MVRRAHPGDSETMECPVCYCNDATCHLVCGHSFCQGCVKEWWNKSTDNNCPMCRAPLYFRGFHKKVEKWEEEKEEKKKAAVYNRILEDTLGVLEEEEEFDEMEAELVMFALKDLSERFQKLTEDDVSDYTEDELYEIITDMFIEITQEKGYWEPKDLLPHERLMFVPKHKDAVKRQVVGPTPRSVDTPPMDMIEIVLVF
jgi:hypothetical protein